MLRNWQIMTTCNIENIYHIGKMAKRINKGKDEYKINSCLFYTQQLVWSYIKHNRCQKNNM